MAENQTQGIILLNTSKVLNSNTDLILKTFIISSYSMIFVLGLSGNALVIFVILRNKAMYTVTNFFITNLAASDILMCIVAVPFTPIALYLENWTLPELVCKLLPMTMAISVYVSTLTSLVISIDRYFVIVYPFKVRMKLSFCRFLLVLIWGLAILASFPLAKYHKKENDVLRNISTCHEKWPDNRWKGIYTVSSFIVQFVLPTIAISFCYFQISRTLQSRCNRKLSKKIKSLSRVLNDIKRKRKTNKMLIAMVVIFIVCWIPLNVLWIITDLIYSDEQSKLNTNLYFTTIFFICHLIAMCSALYNPFLYGWMNENFRQEFCSVFSCWRSRRALLIEQNSTFRKNSKKHPISDYHLSLIEANKKPHNKLLNEFSQFSDEN
uniref:NPYR-9 n=1 Tax=Schmidtea mediterranea TaxID=79327 RepID=A0A193KUS3_SCHMD|nr:NPYR-9 [Schmidtea mediterranea]